MRDIYGLYSLGADGVTGEAAAGGEGGAEAPTDPPAAVPETHGPEAVLASRARPRDGPRPRIISAKFHSSPEQPPPDASVGLTEGSAGLASLSLEELMGRCMALLDDLDSGRPPAAGTQAKGGAAGASDGRPGDAGRHLAGPAPSTSELMRAALQSSYGIDASAASSASGAQSSASLLDLGAASVNSTQRCVPHPLPNGLTIFAHWVANTGFPVSCCPVRSSARASAH